MGYFGCLRQVHLGEIYRKGMVAGKTFISGFLARQNRMFLMLFFVDYPRMHIGNFYPWMAVCQSSGVSKKSNSLGADEGLSGSRGELNSKIHCFADG